MEVQGLRTFKSHHNVLHSLFRHHPLKLISGRWWWWCCYTENLFDVWPHYSLASKKSVRLPSVFRLLPRRCRQESLEVFGTCQYANLRIKHYSYWKRWTSILWQFLICVPRWTAPGTIEKRRFCCVFSTSPTHVSFWNFQYCLYLHTFTGNGKHFCVAILWTWNLIENFSSLLPEI